MDSETTRRAVIAASGTVGALVTQNASFNDELAGSPALGVSEKLQWSDVEVSTPNGVDSIQSGDEITVSGYATNESRYETTERIALSFKYLDGWRELAVVEKQFAPRETKRVRLRHTVGLIEETEDVILYFGGEEVTDATLTADSGELSVLTVSGVTQASDAAGEQIEMIDFESVESGAELHFESGDIIDMEAAL